jgi:hypothetical protein
MAFKNASCKRDRGPSVRPKIDAAVEALVRKFLLKGMGTKATAKATGVGIGHRIADPG